MKIVVATLITLITGCSDAAARVIESRQVDDGRTIPLTTRNPH